MEQTKKSMLINKKVTTNIFIIYTMHTTSTMTDILQKVLYYVRQKQTACTLVVSSRHNIERYAFPVLYTAKKRSKEE